VPTLTLLLRASPEVGAERARLRGAPDRMEASGVAFHARVAAAFEAFEHPAWQREHPECGPLLPIDADGAADDVERRVLSVLAEALPELRSALAAAAT
jgi:thymidylate kinase